MVLYTCLCYQDHLSIFDLEYLEYIDPVISSLGGILFASGVMDAWFLQFYLWLCGISAVLADYNITYDDTDPSIVYSTPEAWARVKVSRARTIRHSRSNTANYLPAFFDLTLLY